MRCALSFENQKGKHTYSDRQNKEHVEVCSIIRQRKKNNGQQLQNIVRSKEPKCQVKNDFETYVYRRDEFTCTDIHKYQYWTTCNFLHQPGFCTKKMSITDSMETNIQGAA